MDFTDYLTLSACLHNYARACDSRDWELLAQVFTADASLNYGGYQFPSTEQALLSIQRTLANCGPTQHLLGNLDVLTVAGNTLTSRVKVRAVHAQSTQPGAAIYEVWGEYRDTLVKTAATYRISRREFIIDYECGSRAVLKGMSQ